MAATDFHPESPRARTVHDLAERLGFAFCGIAPANESKYAVHVREWLANARHGEMAFMAEDVDVRVDPRKLVPGATAVIVVGDGYGGSGRMGRSGRVTEWSSDQVKGKEADSDSAQSATGPLDHSATSPSGRIAAYAQSKDYHARMKKRMHRLSDELRIRWPGYAYRSCVDSAPILEREQALRAGLGWIGKNTMLISPSKGSCFTLGCIVTTLPIQTFDGPVVADHCGTCTRCIDACPTRCISPEGYHLDATRCISYLTIEHRSAIAPDLHEPMGEWLAGCDVCQKVCPYNESPSLPHAARHPVLKSRFNLLDILHWTPERRQNALVNSPLKRIRLDMWKRNALIAAGNHLLDHTDAALLSRIRELSTDETESVLVRVTAQQTLERLTGRWHRFHPSKE
ncbi:MAG: tRNA epoxyqueuosine(34) reductase QueG [Phycisphaera sp.]|nr:tRNA epoxyqueuosine(34) reductase QueG [Phycisphaera sp.]